MAQLKDTAHRIDREPVLFLGCSGAEIMLLAGSGAIAGLVVGLVVAILLGRLIIFLPFVVVFGFISVWKGGAWLARQKEGKPDGYYNKYILSRLSNAGLLKLFVNRSGHWSMRR